MLERRGRSSQGVDWRRVHELVWFIFWPPRDGAGYSASPQLRGGAEGTEKIDGGGGIENGEGGVVPAELAHWLGWAVLPSTSLTHSDRWEGWQGLTGTLLAQGFERNGSDRAGSIARSKWSRTCILRRSSLPDLLQLDTIEFMQRREHQSCRGDLLLHSKI